MLELVRAGRSPQQLAKEFEPSAQAISNWVKQADLDEGRRDDGLTSSERDELQRLRRENKGLKKSEILKKSRGLVRSRNKLDTRPVFQFVKANYAYHSIAAMCRVFAVSSSGYYAWLKREASKREREDSALCKRIEKIHQISKGTYGSPRIQQELKADGTAVSRKRVARLMQVLRLVGVSHRKYITTTHRDRSAQPAPDRVGRNFQADEPNRLWVSDITYIATWAGFLYLAVVLEVWSRKIVGWAMRTDLNSELVLEVLEMAVRQRRPGIEVIHHSDQRSQYTSIAFGRRCREARVTPSMGSVGDRYDYAMCESFFATLECELLNHRTFKTVEEAKMGVFDYIEGWYNTRRRHSGIGYHSSVKYERLHQKIA